MTAALPPCTTSPFGFPADAPMIGAHPNRLTPEAARALLRITFLPAPAPGLRLLKLPGAGLHKHTSNIIDCLGAEDARLVIKQIILGQGMKQPQRPVGADLLAPDGDLPVANPGDLEGRAGTRLGVGSAEPSGERLRGGGGVDTPESQRVLHPNGLTAEIGGERQAQIEVRPIRTGNVVATAAFKMHIVLRLDPDVVLHGDE